MLRFLTALASSDHQFVLAGTNRVLRPGEYIEINVLDIDLVDMGNLGRRALHDVNERLSAANDSISLRNISGEVLSGIARQNFVEHNCCVVGLAVAGKLNEVSFSDLLGTIVSSGSTNNGITEMVARAGR